MDDFTPGQRWVSDNDAALGLGIVQSVAFRTVQIEFPAADETRTYAKATAPLTRVEFDVGDSIKSMDGWRLSITKIEHVRGTVRYHGIRESGEPATMHERELPDALTFNLPQDKLFAGQVDDNRWFELRAATLQHLATQQASTSFGFHGPRVSLIPHQIYIAHEVSKRISPRVLLADEVGLGKTIEAGLILHRLILTGKINRALVIVPEPLLHQWLMELLRRFNLRFTLIDEPYFSHIDEAFDNQDEAVPPENFFDQFPLVLCGLHFACRDDIAPLIAMCHWDILVVDEAHHLEWTPSESSREYRRIETLANQSDSVLLLTATPEQFGTAGHFARLRLLDPARFHSLDSYLAEEKQHAATAGLVNLLLDHQTMAEDDLAHVRSLIDDSDAIDITNINATHDDARTLRRHLIDRLIDQHGTGRMLFRNTRATISGFPRRHFIPAVLDDDRNVTRINWLSDKLRELSPHKVLLICATAETAVSISTILAKKHGLTAGAFHEHMNLLERDRAAAWFADAEDGAQILICSEIGGEGRNFQFLHNIVLFDLPDNPDLVEQRIGRLDRIGQQHDINIHVPVAAGSRDARLSRWYHHALNSFEQSCVTGQHIKAEMEEQFAAYLAGEHFDEDWFVRECRQRHEQMTRQLNLGRNRLLELSGCRQEIASPLIKEIKHNEQENILLRYLENAFDSYGVEIEDHSPGSWILRPGAHLQVDQFPELPEDGITVTTNRETALAREDMHFLSWEHPLVRATTDLILNGERGRVSVCALHLPQLPPHSILIEAIFESNCPAPAGLGIGRYLPCNALRLLVNQDGKDYTQQLPPDSYETILKKIDQEVARQLIERTRATLKKQVEHIEEMAAQQLPVLRNAAIASMHEELDDELQRLLTLQKRNPTIRDEEVQLLYIKISDVESRLQSSTLKLSALRVIYTV
ncbi:MAG: RNA polymerase-associated protein RapA [Nitrospirales bacterium]|nr:MAG: RNA polymerase-associated protein RapA [Nitrospirales bacterium]